MLLDHCADPEDPEPGTWTREQLVDMNALLPSEQTIGSAEAIKMFEDIIHALRESDVPSPSSATH
jgi:hypothetical protein